ncbi:MAG: hypothetical protein PVJ33_16340 [Lysobacterales bacterium]
MSVVLLTASASAWAECNESALEGDWTVFYRDNAFPTSVLAPDETLGISRNPRNGAFSVALSDPEWRSWNAEWEAACVNDQTVLLGAIQRRQGTTTLVIELSRVVTAGDLLRNSAGVVRERQISIRFPQPFSIAEQSGTLAELAKQGLLASHPGHAHGWD